MKIVWNEKKKNQIIPVWEGEKPQIEEAFWKYLVDKKIFKGKEGEVYADLGFYGKNTLLMGFGKKEKCTLETIRKGFFKMGKELEKAKEEEGEIEFSFFEKFGEEGLKAAIEGLYHSTYVFDHYKKKESEPVEITFSFHTEEKASLKEEVEGLMEGVFFSRDLVNEPAMVMTPTRFSEEAKEKLSPLGVKVEIFEKEEIEKLGMTAYLAVSKGSEQAPKFVLMKYLPLGEEVKPAVLVGKGLTYDSGGYSIKPTSGMLTMHCDMGGAGTVAGTIYALAKNKVQKNVIGVTALCENMISGGAYKPGDIISSMSGKTIEIANTDAEGRVTLADSIYYAASKLNPEYLVDLATLTGACIAALGYEYTGAVTNNNDLYMRYQEAAKKAGEKVWLLPSDDALRELVKGERADLRNSQSHGAGTVTAGLFLENFTCDVDWLHLDIAGTAYLPRKSGYLPENATGVCVRSLYRLIEG